jgi:PAS domain S-box-containing protein
MNQIYREMIEDSPMAYVHIKIRKNNKGEYTGLEIRDFNKSYKRFFENYDENLMNEYILNSMKKSERSDWIETFIKASENKKYTKLIYVEKIDTNFNMEIFSIENDEFFIRFTKISNQCVKLSSVLKNSPCLTWIKDRNGVYVDVNDKFLEFFDRTYDEVIGKTDYEIMPKDSAKEFFEQDTDVIKNDKMNTYEDTVISNKNKLGYFQTAKWPLSEDDSNIILGTIGISIEITNKVETFKSMEKNEKLFLEIANNIEESIIIIDEKKAQYISPSFKKMFDVNPDELYNDIGSWRGTKNIVEFENNPKSYEFKGINDFMFKIYKKEREEMWIWARFVPILDEDGNTIKKIGILSDITKRKTLELEIEKLRMDFFANLSHELRTPINLIFSALQVLSLKLNKLGCENFEYFDKYLSIIGQNSNRLLKLVNNLIDTTKLDSGCFNYNPKNNDIISWIEDICLSVSEFVEDNNLSIIFDTDTEEKITGFDQDNMERIILNLISNAIKFNKPGGKIEVTINCRENIEIRVKDDGIGIPEEKLGVIFERFGQVKSKLKKEREGSGIGLTLVKSLVEMHGGSICVNSAVGEGSEFIITLPDELVDEEDDNMAESHSYLSRVNMMKVEFSDIYA